jgi:hypothetical protein
MATKWNADIIASGKLFVFNDAGHWANIVTKAMASFNNLKIGVELKPAKTDELTTNIIVQVSDGSSSYTYKNPAYEDFVGKATFDAAAVHGKTIPFIDPVNKIVLKAAIFLPNKLKGVSDAVKEMVTVHEFIHACGLDNSDHDPIDGIFVAGLVNSGGKLIEPLNTGGKNYMPPARVSGGTRSKITSNWT